MLKSLTVQNYALIRDLAFSPESHLNVITGETGAGKSIMLGALGLVLGNRADTGILSDQNVKCTVEAIFQFQSDALTTFLESRELEVSDEIILRREISPTGKSRAFINDTPVNLTDLKEAGELLIDIHTQHTSLLIRNNKQQLRMIDRFGNYSPVLMQAEAQWKYYKYELQAFEDLEVFCSSAQAEQDFLRFQFEELEKFNPLEGEEIQLEERVELLNHAADIARIGENIAALLHENENSAYNQVQAARSLMKPISGLSAGLKAVSERLDTLLPEIKDLASEIQDIASDSEPNAAELENLNARYSQLQLLLKKHRVDTSHALKQLFQEIGDKLYTADNSIEALEKQREKVKMAFDACIATAKELHIKRIETATQLCIQVESGLHQLGMPKAKLRADLQFQNEFLNDSGASKMQFLFSANGSLEMPLEKVASGGEVSRLNFVIKSILAGKNEIPTLIFDETDTGVSGEIAHKFGEMMRKLGDYRQVIAITHLPQVAAHGNSHYFISKKEVSGKTESFMEKLQIEQRIQKLASMLGGENPGEAALANAKELLQAATAALS